MHDAIQLQAQLKALGDNYAAQLPEKLALVEQSLGQLPQNGWDEEGFASLHRQVHSLAGSGKTFGFSKLGDAARTLEQYLKTLLQERKQLGRCQHDRIRELMQGVQQAAGQRDPEQGSHSFRTDPEKP